MGQHRAPLFPVLLLAALAASCDVTVSPGPGALRTAQLAARTAAERRRQALATVATLDGLLLLRQMAGARAANTAARELGIA